MQKIQVKITYEVDVTDWYEDERLTRAEKIKKLQEDFDDISVFSNHCNYETLKGVSVKYL